MSTEYHYMILLLALAVLNRDVAQAINCIQCASLELSPSQPGGGLWQLTGLPKPFPTTTGTNSWYTGECKNIPSAVRNQLSVACSSLCITMAVNDPRVLLPVSDLSKMNYFVVRGCWDTLTGQEYFASNTQVKQEIKDRCEMGKYRNFNDEGGMVDAWAYNKFCEGEHCNSEIIDPMSTTCKTNLAPHPNPLNCYECRKEDWNCWSNTCSATTEPLHWCKKITTVINDKWTYTKTCSPINPYGRANGCGYWDTKHNYITRSAGVGASVNVENKFCFCNDKDKCNGATTTAVSLVAVLISFAVSAVLM